MSHCLDPEHVPAVASALIDGDDKRLSKQGSAAVTWFSVAPQVRDACSSGLAIKRFCWSPNERPQTFLLEPE